MWSSNRFVLVALPILLLSFPTSASVISLLGRQPALGGCSITSDNSQNTLSSTFTLASLHYSKDGTASTTFPISSSPDATFNSAATLSISSSSVPTFGLSNGVLTSSNTGAPCVLYQDIAGDADAVVVCSLDPGLQDPTVNSLAGTTWATTTQCLDSTTKTVVLVPVFSDGVRHSKPFYADTKSGGDDLLVYFTGADANTKLLTSLLLQVVFS